MATEDFTTYTENDPSSQITIDSATQISITALDRNSEGYVYDNKGAAHFGGDFNHKIDFNLTSGAVSGWVFVWALTNAVDDIKGIFDASGSCFSSRVSLLTGTASILLIELDGGTNYSDVAYTVTAGTDYYVVVDRDESIGSYGQLRQRIYSDAERTTLLNTQTVSLHTSKKDFQYIFPVNSWNSGDSSSTLTGTISNLDLQEDAVVTLTGASATGQVGTLSPIGAALVTITGISATGQAGTAAATGGAAIEISGASATGQVGVLTLTTGATVSLPRASATGQAGIVTAIGGSVATLTGISSNADAGTLTAVIAQTIELTGISASSIVGVLDITTGATVDITGVIATGQVGAVSALVDATEVTIPGYRVHKIQHENRVFIVLSEDDAFIAQSEDRTH